MMSAQRGRYGGRGVKNVRIYLVKRRQRGERVVVKSEKMGRRCLWMSSFSNGFIFSWENYFKKLFIDNKKLLYKSAFLAF